MTILTLTQIPMILGQLQVEKIETNVGYTILQDKTSLIPKNYNYTIHIIDLNYFDEIITELKMSINKLPEGFKDFLMTDIENIVDKTKTLKVHNNLVRKKRGLINLLGSINKFITGTMDDDDRQTIIKHFDITDNNNLKFKETLNKQIKINDNFNKTMIILLNTIKEGRLVIEEFMKNEINITTIKFITFEIKLKIQEIDKIINDIQDNIIFCNLNIIHPSLLTHQEIVEYQIDANKLKLIKVAFTKFMENKIIFLIKIPFRMFEINEKLIIPLANEKDCYSLNTPSVRAYEYDNKYFEFDKSKSLNQLINLNHCIINKNCISIKNCNSEIINIDDSSLLIQLANKINLTSNFDKRYFELNGNYLIKYFNGTITLNDEKYYNNIKEIKNNYVLPNLEYKPKNNTLSFKEINIITEDNINQIKLLQYHKNIIYSSVLLITIIIFLMIIFGTIIYCKFINVKLLKKNINKIQENFNLKEGGVTFHSHTKNTCQNNGNNAHKLILF